MPGAIKARRRRPIGTSPVEDRTPRPDLSVSSDLDGTSPYWKIINTDPERHYVWANEDDRTIQSVDYYESMGYERCLVKSADTVRRLLGKWSEKVGQPIRVFGHVLVSILKSELEAANAPRMQAYDNLEAKIIDRNRTALDDHFRGIGHQYARIDKDTTSHGRNITVRESDG